MRYHSDTARDHNSEIGIQMDLSVGSVLGGCEIVSPIGAGGLGEVNRARDRQLDRRVALKVLPESFASDSGRLMRFHREAGTPQPSTIPTSLRSLRSNWQRGKAGGTDLSIGRFLRSRVPGAG